MAGATLEDPPSHSGGYRHASYRSFDTILSRSDVFSMNTIPAAVSEIREVSEAFIADPLTDVTRRQRTGLLISTAILFLATYAGLYPTEINAFGIKAQNFSPTAFIFCLKLGVIYFALAFATYAAADLKVWNSRLYFLRLRREIGAHAMVEHYAADIPAYLRDRHIPEDLHATIKENADREMRELLRELHTRLNENWPSYVFTYRWRIVFDVGAPFAIMVVTLVYAALKRHGIAG